MVKKDQDSKSDTDGIGNFQYGKSVRAFSHNKGINLGKKSAQIYIVIKSHNRKGSTEKRNQAYKKDFDIPKKDSCGRADTVGDDKAGLADRRDINRRFCFLNHF